jgi:hypothetical protein
MDLDNDTIIDDLGTNSKLFIIVAAYNKTILLYF